MVQPMKTRPCLTERLLMGRKESSQVNVEKVIFFLGKLDKAFNQYPCALYGLVCVLVWGGGGPLSNNNLIQLPFYSFSFLDNLVI